MTFLTDPRFPDEIAYGSSGGPVYQTSVIVIASGHEQRNSTWSYPRHRFDVASGVKHLESLEDLIAHFHVAMGRANAFRFKDWGDFKSSAYESAITDTDQTIATGDNAEVAFQMIKTYSRGAYSKTREITKPIDGTVVVSLDGSPQTETTHYSIDYETGIITFLTAPGSSVAVQMGYEFDVPVRFDVDQLDTSLEAYVVGSIEVPLVEVKV